MKILKRFLFLEPDGDEQAPWKRDAWSQYGFKPLPLALPYCGPQIEPAKDFSDPRTYLTRLSDGDILDRLVRRYVRREAEEIVFGWREMMGSSYASAPIAWTTCDGWLVFFVPWLLGQNRTVEDQLELLQDMRRSYRLPDHHLRSFGSAHLLAALCLAYMRENGCRNLFNGRWVRTETPHHLDGARIALYGDGGEVRTGYDLHGRASHHIAVMPVTIEVL